MTEPRDVPPAHQTATFDQAYAGISATIDELVASYRHVRSQNAATREIDIAGLVAFLLESPNSRESFVEHYVVAVVRLAEQADQVGAETERDTLRAAIAEVRRLCDLTIAASCRVQAIDQARDTLAVLDRALDTPTPTEETP